MLSRLLPFTLVVLTALLPRGGQNSQGQKAAPRAGAPASVEQVLGRYVEALGGREALEKINTRVTRGSMELVGTPIIGEHENYAKAPNKSVTATNLPGLGVVRDGHDGQSAWAQDPKYGLRDLKGAELASAKFDAELHKELKLRELVRQLEPGPAAKVEGRAAHVLVGTLEGGSPLKLYFDQESGLLLRMDTVRESPEDKVAFEVYFEDYREVDKVKVPFRVRWQTSDFASVIRVSSVKHNEPVDDAKFKKPSGN